MENVFNKDIRKISYVAFLLFFITFFSLGIILFFLIKGHQFNCFSVLDLGIYTQGIFEIIEQKTLNS